ncbi:Ger(x)C family spore germination protein, partial [Effusibacillus lacus]
MKRSKWRLALLLMLLLPVLNGCWSQKEMEHMFYVHAIGLDYVDGQYVVYAQILNFAPLGKAEGGGKSPAGQSPAWIGKGVGTTFDTAAHNLYTTTQRYVFWGHLTAVVFSENLLRRGIGDALDMLGRFQEFRYTTWIFGTRDPLEKILTTAPILEESPVYSQLGDPRDTFYQSSFIPPIRLNKLVAALREPGRTAYIPNLTVFKDRWMDVKQKYPALSMNGVHVLKDSKSTAFFPRSELVGWRWMLQEIPRTPLEVSVNDRPAAVLICENPKIKIRPQVQANRATFRIKVGVTASIIEMIQPEQEAVLRDKAALQIEQEIRSTFNEGVESQSDIFQLGAVLHRKSPKAWKAISQNGKLPLRPDTLQSVDVTVKIVSSGKKF